MPSIQAKRLRGQPYRCKGRVSALPAQPPEGVYRRAFSGQAPGLRVQLFCPTARSRRSNLQQSRFPTLAAPPAALAAVPLWFSSARLLWQLQPSLQPADATRGLQRRLEVNPEAAAQAAFPPRWGRGPTPCARPARQRPHQAKDDRASKFARRAAHPASPPGSSAASLFGPGLKRLRGQLLHRSVPDRCVPARMYACMPASLRAHAHACLPGCMRECMSACLPCCMHARVPALAACMHAGPPCSARMHARRSASWQLRACQPGCMRACRLAARIHASPPGGARARMPACVRARIRACLPCCARTCKSACPIGPACTQARPPGCMHACLPVA